MGSGEFHSLSVRCIATCSDHRKCNTDAPSKAAGVVLDAVKVRRERARSKDAFVRVFPAILSFEHSVVEKKAVRVYLQMCPIIAVMRHPQKAHLTAVEDFDFSLEGRGEDSADVFKAAFKDFHCK